MESKQSNEGTHVKGTAHKQIQQQKHIDNNLVFSVFVGFVITGLVIKMFFSTKQPDGSSGPASALIWGYSMVCFSILGILFIATTVGGSKDKPLEKLLSSGVPLLILMLLLLWAISFNLKYYDKINKGFVAEEYYTWSDISTTIIIFQVLMVSIYIKNVFLKKINGGNIDGKSSKDSNKAMMAMYFLVLLNAICLGIQQVVLDNFTTDG